MIILKEPVNPDCIGRRRAHPRKLLNNSGIRGVIAILCGDVLLMYYDTPSIIMHLRQLKQMINQPLKATLTGTVSTDAIIQSRFRCQHLEKGLKIPQLDMQGLYPCDIFEDSAQLEIIVMRRTLEGENTPSGRSWRVY